MAKLLCLILFTVISLQLNALPRFALKKGGTCFDCHSNPTGGTLRNSGGWSYGKNNLPLISPRQDFKMSNKLTDNISFGFDFRGQYLAIFQEGSAKSDFQRMTGSVYTGIALSEEIDVSARYDFVWGIWEAYAVARILPNESYIKGGSFIPNYGIRIDDHTAYTRGGDLGVVTSPGQDKAGLIYEPRYIESGGELGINISDFGLLTASVGTSRQQLFITDPTYTASLQVNPSFEDVGLMLGASTAIFKTQRFNENFEPVYPQVEMYGGFAGLALGSFSLLGEMDFANDYSADGVTSTALMFEGSYTILKGLDAVIRYDRFDLSADESDDVLSRYVIGFEFHPYNFIEIRPQYRIQQENPKIKNDVFLVQIHLWY